MPFNPCRNDHLGVLLEKLYPIFLVGRVPDDGRASDVQVALDDDGEERAEHDDRLERVGPHDGLDAALSKN